MKKYLAFHSISSAVISKNSDIDFTDDSNAELECITLPHAVNVTPLESFAGWVGFCLKTNEKSVALENPMNGSP